MHVADGVRSGCSVSRDCPGPRHGHDDHFERYLHDHCLRSIAARHPTMIVQLFDFQQGIRDNLVPDRMMAMFSGFFGLLASVLVIIGIYDVLLYFVAQHRNEIGVRIALGAARLRVIGLVLRDTVVMLLAGIVLGTVLSLLAGRAASTLLFGLQAWGPGYADYQHCSALSDFPSPAGFPHSERQGLIRSWPSVQSKNAQQKETWRN